MVRHVWFTYAVALVSLGAACGSDGGSSDEAQAGSGGAGAASGSPTSGGTTSVGDGGMDSGAEAGAPGSLGGTTGTGGSNPNQGGGGSKAMGGADGMAGGSSNPEGCDLPEAVVSCLTSLAPGIAQCTEASEEGQAADFIRAACGGNHVDGQSCPDDTEDAELVNYCVGMNGVISYCYAGEGMPQCSGPPAACTNQGGLYCTP